MRPVFKQQNQGGREERDKVLMGRGLTLETLVGCEGAFLFPESEVDLVYLVYLSKCNLQYVFKAVVKVYMNVLSYS